MPSGTCTLRLLHFLTSSVVLLVVYLVVGRLEHFAELPAGATDS
jgi:hypothetical protein